MQVHAPSSTGSAQGWWQVHGSRGPRCPLLGQSEALPRGQVRSGLRPGLSWSGLWLRTVDREAPRPWVCVGVSRGRLPPPVGGGPWPTSARVAWPGDGFPGRSGPPHLRSFVAPAWPHPMRPPIASLATLSGPPQDALPGCRQGPASLRAFRSLRSLPRSARALRFSVASPRPAAALDGVPGRSSPAGAVEVASLGRLRSSGGPAPAPPGGVAPHPCRLAGERRSGRAPDG